MSCSRIKIKK